jgi:hypothetical protein
MSEKHAAASFLEQHWSACEFQRLLRTKEYRFPFNPYLFKTFLFIFKLPRALPLMPPSLLNRATFVILVRL